MINATKEIEIDGKKYEIINKGVKQALLINALFKRLVINSRINLDASLKNEEIFKLLDAGLDERAVNDIETIIINCVNSPKIDGTIFNSMNPDTPLSLFQHIWEFYIGEAEKKN